MNVSATLATLNDASAFELYRLQANRANQGQVLELRRKQAVVLDLVTRTRWLISYAPINLDGADVQIREQPRQGRGRNEAAIGDVVGFLDRNQQERNGRIVRLNDKTVTLLCGQQQWRVAYALLHRVVEGSAFSGEPLELDVSDTCANTEDIGQDE